MNKKLIVANWKNHPDTLAEGREILDFTNSYLESLEGEKDLSLVFCPPLVFLEEIGKMLKMSHLEDISFLGAQNVAIDDKITLTGEVSGSMLRKLGVQYVIIGHSERKWKLGESDETVNKKLKSVLGNELIPIVCIGEKTRDGDFKNFLEEQVESTFAGLNADEISKCIIAYEPVWAISTNPNAKPDTPQSALESIKIIRAFLATSYPGLAKRSGAGKLQATSYLYGGSVNSKNVAGFLREKEINGVLIGGASVNKGEFVKILTICVG